MSDWIILAGYICGGVTRGVVVGIIVTLVSLLFADVSIHSYGLMLAVFVLTSILFLLAGFSLSLLRRGVGIKS